MGTGKNRPKWRRCKGGYKKVFPDRSAIYVERSTGLSEYWTAFRCNRWGDSDRWNRPGAKTAEECMKKADETWPS